MGGHTRPRAAGHCFPQQRLREMPLHLKGSDRGGHARMDISPPCCVEGKMDQQLRVPQDTNPISPSDVFPEFQGSNPNLLLTSHGPWICYLTSVNLIIFISECPHPQGPSRVGLGSMSPRPQAPPSGSSNFSWGTFFFPHPAHL